MSNALTSRIAEDFAAAAGAPQAPAAVRQRAAIDLLTTVGLPTTREENWKYANLRALERLRFLPAAGEHARVVAAQLPPAIAGFTRYVFIDGRFAPQLSGVPAPGAAFTPLAAAAAQPAAAPLEGRGPDQRFALLNEAFATDGARLSLSAGADPARLELIFVASADAAAGASYPRIELRAHAHSSAEVLERHMSADATASFVNSAVEIDLAQGARLTHYRLQQLSGRSILFDTLTATLGPQAAYRLHAVSTGAASARSTQRLRLAGEHAQLSMAIAALGERQQVQDSFALVEHAAPRARTEQLFRGIAADRSRVAFNGKMVVAQGAQGTDSQQSLRGLLAGPEAEIDVRPQLEIYTDDVRCSHGATAGKLDDNMLFYLLARGLDRDTAQRLLKWAFLADAFARIEVADLRRQIEENLAQVLKDSALKELL